MKKRKYTLTIVVLAVVAALGFAACSSSGGDSGPGGGVDDIEGGRPPSPGEGDSPDDAQAVAATEVSIKDFEFHPDKIEAAAGTTITVTNDDESQHTLTADDASFDTGILEPGESKTITVSGASAAPFHCEIHNFMTGEFVVAPG